MNKPTGSAVAIAIAALVGVTGVTTSGATATSGPNSFSSTYQAVPKSQLHDLATVPLKTLKKVGVGTTQRGRNYQPQRDSGTRLRRNGKPELAFMDAEFCPYCATVRWGLAVALDRFGRFSKVTTMHSATDDMDIQTLSFRYAKYTSKYLTFGEVVNEDVNHKHVETPPPAIKKAWKHYDGRALGYPFLDFSGRTVVLLSPVDPSRLRGLSRPTIAGDLADPASKIAKAIDGEANEFTAAICLMTKNKPARVCDVKWLAAIGAGFPKYKGPIF